MRTHGLTLAIVLLVAAGCGGKEEGADAATAGTTPAPAERGTVMGAGEPTAVDFNNYPLEMDKMRKLLVTLKGFKEAGKKDSEVDKATTLKLDRSTTQYIADLEANAAANGVLQKAGWSAKDFVWTQAAWLQSWMTQQAVETVPGATYPPGTNQKNVDFVKANKQEIEKLAKDSGVSF